MSFLRSYYVWLILIRSSFFLSWLIYRRWKVKLLESHFSYQFKKVHMNKRMSLIQVIMISLGFLFSILALTGPKYGYRWEKVETKGVDIVISLIFQKAWTLKIYLLVDLKEVNSQLQRFIGAAEGDRFGLVTFAGEALKIHH